MKKLNITKEQFEKSRYFKNKYGTLEYVSESGKAFKTSKGKVLMFNEGFKDKIKGFGRTVGNFMEMFTKGTNVYVWHSGTGDWYDALDNNEPVWCGKIVERKASSGEYGIEVSKLKSKDAKHRKLKTGDSVDIYDVAGAYQSGTVSKIDGNMLYVARNVSSGNNAEEIDNNDKELFDTTESSKKFGKKFVKESASKNFEKFCEELKSKFSDIDGVKIYMMDNEDGTYTITVTIRRFDDDRSVWYPEDVKKIGQFIKRKCDRFGWAVEKNVEYRLGLTDFYITETESTNESSKKFGKKFNESYHGRVEVKASIVATGRTAEEALELLHNRLLDADAKIIDENEKPNPEIVDKYNYWFDENMGDVDFDICRDNNSNGFLQMDIKAI